MSFIETHGNYILIGDLNSHCSMFKGPTNTKGRSLDNILSQTDGKILNNVNMPTNFWNRNGSNTNSIIDLIIANEYLANKCLYCETLEVSAVTNTNQLYYHLPVITEFEVGIKPRKNRISFHKSFLYDKANWPQFRNYVDSEMMNIGPELDIESLNNIIVNSILNAAEKHIPKVKEKLKRDNNFDAQTVEVLKTRNFWGRRYRRCRDKYSAEKYLEMEKLANEQIETFRINQWENFLKNQGPHPLSSIPFWRRINRLRANKRHSKIDTLIIDGITYETPENKANIFATSLENKFKMDLNPRYNNELKTNIEEFFKNGEGENSLSSKEKKIIEFTPYDLHTAIKNMNSKTSRDPVGLSNKILKNIGENTKDRLLTLFNWCLKDWQVPQTWKHSIISMLLKNGQSSNELSSYRPISMTPCLARLFERLILFRIQKFLDKKKILIMNQSGFRKSRQTKDNILTVIQTAQEGFNLGEKTTAIFFDIAAAFDKVWHDGLIYKLFKLGLPYYLIRICISFLRERTFSVKVDGTNSRICIIECGVPQGGVLSPTLFQLYINDLPLTQNSGEITILFADDIAFIKRYKYKLNNKLIANAKIQAEKESQIFLNTLEKWMNDWRLTLAPKKCNQITFSKAKSTNNDEMNIKLYDQPITSENNPKFLGIVFDVRLNFAAHLQAVKKKVGDRVNLLKILSYDKTWRLPEKVLVKMYKSLVLSVLDYASITTGACSEKTLDDYETIQNNCLRIILKKKLTDKIPCQELREKAGVSTIGIRHKKLMLDYYEGAIVTENPLLKIIFVNYSKYKSRNHINESLARSEDGNISRETLILIKKHNQMCLNEKDIHETTLCQAPLLVKEMILDLYPSRESFT